MQNPVRKCPVCGSEIVGQVEGLCPKCLLEEALVTGFEEREEPEAPYPSTPFTQTRIRYFGDYELLEEIARGGMGVVFKARQQTLNRIVALKVILPGALGSSDVLIKRFRLEAEAAAQLDHPNIVPIYEIGEDQGCHYFSMRFIDGDTLANRARAGELTPITVSTLMMKAASAMHFAHQRGVLHRDLKPGNILIDGNGEPFLVDFGVAKLAYQDRDITRTQAILGTLNYMSPEQASGRARVLTTASDIFSLGVILYELLTGKLPFKGEDNVATLRAICEKEPDYSQLIQAAGKDLATICLKCLEKNPDARYATAGEVAADLGRWLRSEPISARPLSSRERLVKWVRRKPAVAGLAAVSVFTLVGAVAGLTFGNRVITKHKTAATSAAGRERTLSYYGQITAIQHALGSTNLEYAEQLLKNCPEDLRGWEWRHLKRRCNPNAIRVVEGHLGRRAYSGQALNSIDKDLFPIITQGQIPMTADGSRVALARSNSIIIVAVDSGETVQRFRVEKESVACLALTLDGRFLAAAEDEVTKNKSGANRLYLWDVFTGRELFDGSHAISMDFISLHFDQSGGRLVALCRPEWYPHALNRKDPNSPEVLVFDTASLKLIRSFHASGYNAGLSDDGKELTITQYSGVELWDVESGALVRKLPYGAGHLNDDQSFLNDPFPNAFFGLAFSPDSRRLAVATRQGWLYVWDTQTGTQEYEGRVGANQVAFDRTGNRLAIAGRNLPKTGVTSPMLQILDARTFEPIQSLPTSAKALGLALSSHTVSIVTGNIGYELGLMTFDLNASHAEYVLEERGYVDTRNLGFHPKENELTEATVTGIRVWDVEGRRVRHTLIEGEFGAPCIAYSPNGSLIAVGDQDGKVTLWDRATAKPITEFSTQSGRVEAIAFSPGGDRIAFLAGHGLTVYDIQEKKTVFALNKPKVMFWRAVTFSPTGRYLAVNQCSCTGDSLAQSETISDCYVTLLDAATGTIIRKLTQGDGTLAFSPDETRLAVGSTGSVSIVDLNSGRQLRTDVESAGIVAVAFSRDGTRIGVASKGELKLFDVLGRFIMSLPRAGENVAFNSDGNLIASGGKGGIGIWSGASLLFEPR